MGTGYTPMVWCDRTQKLSCRCNNDVVIHCGCGKTTTFFSPWLAEVHACADTSTASHRHLFIPRRHLTVFSGALVAKEFSEFDFCVEGIMFKARLSIWFTQNVTLIRIKEGKCAAHQVKVILKIWLVFLLNFWHRQQFREMPKIQSVRTGVCDERWPKRWPGRWAGRKCH